MSKKPDFLVVGLQRSGTHWVSALLNAHPDIACFPALPFRSESPEYDMKRIGEVHLFNTLASLEPADPARPTRPLENYLTQLHGIFADLVPLKDQLSKEQLYKKFIERYEELCDRQIQGKRLVGETTPAYIFHLDFIDRFYPGIKKICVIRDPKDQVVSWHFNQIRKGRKKANEPVTDEFIQDYLEKQTQLEYQALVNYDGELKCIVYKDLHQDIKLMVEDLIEYLGMEYDDSIVRKMIFEGSFEHLSDIDSKGKGRKLGEQKIESHYRKGIAGDWKNHLTDKQAMVIDNFLKEIRKRAFIKYGLSD